MVILRGLVHNRRSVFQMGDCFWNGSPPAEEAHGEDGVKIGPAATTDFNNLSLNIYAHTRSDRVDNSNLK